MFPPLDNSRSEVMQKAALRSRRMTQRLERNVHPNAVTFRQHAFGLLDDDTAVQGVLELVDGQQRII